MWKKKHFDLNIEENFYQKIHGYLKNEFFDVKS